MKLQLSEQPLTYGAQYFDGMMPPEVCQRIIKLFNECPFVIPIPSQVYHKANYLPLDDDVAERTPEWGALDEAICKVIGEVVQKYADSIPGAPLSKCQDQGYYLYQFEQEGYSSPSSHNTTGHTMNILQVHIFLNDDFVGGNLRLEPKGDEIAAKLGRAVVVPCTWMYATADDPVVSGTKYKLSTTITYIDESFDALITN